MSDEEAIRRTLAQYAHFCDDGRFDDWADLFTEDARFIALGQTYTGRDQAKSWIMQHQTANLRGKHVCANPVIDVDGDAARAWTDYIFVDRAGAIISIGRYHDRLVRQPDRWRFQERRIVFIGDEA